MQTRLFLKYFIATIWFINGFLFKVLNLVPRHQEIVSRILGVAHAHLYTIIIGIGEVCMGIWIIQGDLPKLNALMQIIIIALYNILEYYMAPDLLLFGYYNYAVAAVFMLIIFYYGFILRKD
ncbi:MAG: DoxX-like family protein [Niabella sp.]